MKKLDALQSKEMEQTHWSHKLTSHIACWVNSFYSLNENEPSKLTYDHKVRARKINKYSAQNSTKTAAAGKQEVDAEWSRDVQQDNLFQYSSGVLKRERGETDKASKTAPLRNLFVENSLHMTTITILEVDLFLVVYRLGFTCNKAYYWFS